MWNEWSKRFSLMFSCDPIFQPLYSNVGMIYIVYVYLYDIFMYIKDKQIWTDNRSCNDIVYSAILDRQVRYVRWDSL